MCIRVLKGRYLPEVREEREREVCRATRTFSKALKLIQVANSFCLCRFLVVTQVCVSNALLPNSRKSLQTNF